MANKIDGINITGNYDGKTLDAAISIDSNASEVLRQVADNSVSLTRTPNPATSDLPLWVVIRKATEAISFTNYSRFIEIVLCGDGLNKNDNFAFAAGDADTTLANLQKVRALPYNDTDAYRLLKVATEAFLMVNCGVAVKFSQADADDLNQKLSLSPGVADLNDIWNNVYLKAVNGSSATVLPYLSLILSKLRDSPLVQSGISQFFSFPTQPMGANNPRPNPDVCQGILLSKLTRPCFLELIWSYWMEEAALVQTMNAISLRFQNVRGRDGRDPLAMLEIDPLRPVNNLLWGYIQDEQHRLSMVRRTFEYSHEYGISLLGKAVPQLRPADNRSKFLESLHNLLYLAAVFFKEDDDTTVIADGFPLLNALKEVHLELSKGAHNQYGDLPWTARIEMLMQQWLLARPEFREFLPTRTMVAYPEPWMDRVEAMKTLKGWHDISIIHFYNLAVFGEKLLLSIRFGNWSAINDRDSASNWARFWRSEMQGYWHAYRAVTGVDLTAEASTQQQTAARALQPSALLRQRLLQQSNRKAALSAARR